MRVNPKYWKLVFILLLAWIFTSLSCRRDDPVAEGPGYMLMFSADTVIFDTLFTTIGSTTRILKVFNTHDKKLKVSRIFLAGGVQSPYRVNIDGAAATVLTDIEIEARDSIFIFIRVTVDPLQQDNPLIVKDSLLFETNGNVQDIDLVAWGQDAHYFIGTSMLPGFRFPYSIIANENESVTWINDKPYVIYGYGVVDSAGSLIIESGVNVHFHHNSGLWVYRGGTLVVSGTLEEPVIFQGDRLEMEYKELPGQWDRIWINEGGENSFQNAIVKNGFIGIQAEVISPDNTLPVSLRLENTVIRNMSRWGLFTIAYRVEAGNCVFFNCAENTLFLSTGGYYDFRHCTVANFWNFSIRQNPMFTLSNYIVIEDAGGNPVTYLGSLENAYFGNCIFFGNLEEEILLAKDPAVGFNYRFDHCLLKTTMEMNDQQHFINCLRNQDPLFLDPYTNKLEPDTLSPVIDAGDLQVITGSPIPVVFDLKGNNRISDQGPDLGAYEYKPE
ncbi:MAG: hypothetical protein JW861_02570 [Bacteroidales bacterium]|nr:hypothetical protein [Bacteroidales bacterium]